MIDPLESSKDTVVEAVGKASRNPTVLLVVLVVMALLVAYLAGQNQAYKQAAMLPKTTSVASIQVTATPTATTTIGPVETLQVDDHVLGSRSAKVTLIEYSDLECPFCKQFQSTIDQVRQDYGDKVAIVYRNYPLSIHQNAEIEAEAAECAASIGGENTFWKFISTVFQRTTSNGTGFSTQALGPLGKELGMDQVRFQQCIDAGTSKAAVQHDIATGTAVGVQGTPTSIILSSNHTPQLLPGAYSYTQLKQTLDSDLQ